MCGTTWPETSGTAPRPQAAKPGSQGLGPRPPEGEGAMSKLPSPLLRALPTHPESLTPALVLPPLGRRGWPLRRHALKGLDFFFKYVPAVHFVSPSARVTAAKGQAGEEVGGGPLGQKPGEVRAEQPGEPLSPHFGKRQDTDRGHGARGETHVQQACA